MTSAEVMKEWREHWPLVLSASIGMSMSSIVLTSMGAFIHPLEQAFNWSRTQVSAGLMIYACVGVICAPLYGRLVDKLGPRRLAVPGVFLCGVAIALFATLTGSPLQWFCLWVLYALAAQVPKPVTWTAGVSSQFEAGRGQAIAFTLIGGSVGGMLWPVLASSLIVSHGWRAAYAVMGLGAGAVATVFCYFFFYSHRDRPNGRAGHPAPAAMALPTGVSAREGLLSATFIKLAATAFLSNALSVGLMIHLIPLLTAKGMSLQEAAWLIGLTGLGAILGAFISGGLVNRMPGNLLASLVFGAPVLCSLLLLLPSLSFVYLAVLIQATASGAQGHLYAYLTTRHFGLRAYGAIFGVILSITALGVGVGPLLGAFIYDKTGSYDMFLYACIPMGLISALLVLSMGRYPELKAAPAIA